MKHDHSIFSIILILSIFLLGFLIYYPINKEELITNNQNLNNNSEIKNSVKENLLIQEPNKNKDLLMNKVHMHFSEVEKLNNTNMISCSYSDDFEIINITFTLENIYKIDKHNIEILNGNTILFKDLNRPEYNSDNCNWEAYNSTNPSLDFEMIINSTFTEHRMFDCEIKKLNSEIFKISPEEKICFI